MPSIQDDLQWAKFEIDLRSMYEKSSIEHIKIAADFSKLIITNLIWINAASVGALPVLAKFIGFSDTKASFIAVLPSAISFTVGLIAALLCALVTYRNFMLHSHANSHYSNCEINAMRLGLLKTLPVDMRQIYEQTRDEALENGEKSRTKVNTSYYLGHIAGWVSLGAFLTGCWLLIKAAP